ncbi:hypothetical protein lerEdw1_007312 [Lerista edwardsae]|nr:hypothetical protein lerEdw1_007312 [Lerista edwardsae]
MNGGKAGGVAGSCKLAEDRGRQSGTMVDSQYVLPNDIGIATLDCAEAFQLLSTEERLYAHYLSRACWYGGLVVLLQTSPESPAIYTLISRLFRSQDPSQLGEVARAHGLSEEEYQAFLVYAAAVYANMGNYKSFGDTKFVPNLPKASSTWLEKGRWDGGGAGKSGTCSAEKLKRLVWESQAFKEHPKEMEGLWGSCGEQMFSLEPTQKHLGLCGEGLSTYFSANCSMEDAKLAQEFLDSENISAYNTRLFKTDVNGKASYEVRLASVLSDDSQLDEDMTAKMKCFEFQGHQFTVTRGDYSPLLERVVANLQKAQEHAANLTQEKMLAHYITSFTQGSIKAHKEGSRCWIQDKGPIVESYIGFIESYRDPYGSRGEFEGFVAVVNKAMSAKFARLVGAAERLLKELPWPRAFEKDSFLKPDFTSLDVLTFAGSGIPAGINIPNYDDIRQTDGFKNVSLGNVLAVGCSTQRDKLTFLAEEDKDLYIKWKGPSFEVQVGLHELLGHGSGKLFVQDDKGNCNFDREAVINPETGERVRISSRAEWRVKEMMGSQVLWHGRHPIISEEMLVILPSPRPLPLSPQIRSWYRGGETWDSKFSSVASSYEECRAECVGLYLCLNKEVLGIFDLEGEAAEDVIYINWLNMVRAGLLALEFYTPESRTWRQAHMQARFVILRVLLEAGGGAGVAETHHWCGRQARRCHLAGPRQDCGRGEASLGALPSQAAGGRGGRGPVGGLRGIALPPKPGHHVPTSQVLKSTADVSGGRALYEAYSAVTDDEPQHFLTLRDTVLLRKEARKLFVQANTRLEGQDVVLVQYDSSAAGLVKSFRDRFPKDAEVLEQHLLDLAHADAHYWGS